MMKTVFILIIAVVQTSTLAGDADVTSETWKPPIGIPVPSFGIEETYRMYNEESARNPDLVYQENGSGGYFTHYVNSNDINSTNTGNPYGSIAVPRKTIPRNLPAGSVVELHGSCLRNGGVSGYIFITGQGTEAMPIFIRGVDMPRVGLKGRVGHPEKTSYLIMEGISWYSGEIICPDNSTVFNTHHVSVRNCEYTSGYGSSSGGEMIIASYSDNFTENVVFYNNKVHDSGIWEQHIATGDRDIGEVSVGAGARYVWILENELYHHESDGFIVCPSNQGISNDSDYCPHHIYIGKNVAYDNKQTGFWSKTGRDIIFSQNISHGHRPSSSNFGSGLGFQYDPKRVWFLFNHSYDNSVGIGTASSLDNNPPREEIYFIGNLLNNNLVAGIQINGLSSSADAKAICNVIYNCPKAIDNDYYASKLGIYNNVLAQYTNAIYFPSDEPFTWQNSRMSHNALDGSGNIVWGSTYTNIAAFQAGTEQGDKCITTNLLFVEPLNGDFRFHPDSPINNMETSDKVQMVFDRFLELYGIDLTEDIEGIERTYTPPAPDAADTNHTSPPVITTPDIAEPETTVSDTTDVKEPVDSESNSAPPDTQQAQTAASKIENPVSPAETKSSQEKQENKSGKEKTEDSSKKTITVFKGRKIKMRKIFEKSEQLYHWEGSDKTNDKVIYE